MNLIFSEYFVSFILFTFFAFPLLGRANDPVVVTFTGISLAKSCDITTGGKDQSIKMGTYDTNGFLNVGNISPGQTFTINVQEYPTAKSAVYDPGVSVNMQFTSGADAINNASLRLSVGAGSATGLGIEILDNSDMATTINGGSGFRDLVLNENGNVNLTFKLRYKSTQGNVHAGQANALLCSDINYQ